MKRFDGVLKRVALVALISSGLGMVVTVNASARTAHPGSIGVYAAKSVKVRHSMKRAHRRRTSGLAASDRPAPAFARRDPETGLQPLPPAEGPDTGVVRGLHHDDHGPSGLSEDVPTVGVVKKF